MRRKVTFISWSVSVLKEDYPARVKTKQLTPCGGLIRSQQVDHDWYLWSSCLDIDRNPQIYPTQNICDNEHCVKISEESVTRTKFDCASLMLETTAMTMRMHT
jgi:hypothetical protein